MSTLKACNVLRHINLIGTSDALKKLVKMVCPVDIKIQSLQNLGSELNTSLDYLQITIMK